ncbi:hypothetical protein WMY93_001709 [Mugilogobius chulae]|uniref:G-protein coupled receptors family 1 profile domain-containing protein n=1 Tax=Mugilogobius chulae TaxID=88201 RepID=A0AAW0PSS7_9GOBI
MIVISWSLATAFACVLVSGERGRETRCAITRSSKFSVVAVVFVFYIPAVVMFALYSKILLAVRKQARSIQSANVPEGVSKPERKATFMLAMVICVFLISWAPFCISITFWQFYPVLWKPLLPMLETFKFLGWLNSMLNPLIYSYSHSWFRSAFRVMLTGEIFTGPHANTRL